MHAPMTSGLKQMIGARARRIATPDASDITRDATAGLAGIVTGRTNALGQATAAGHRLSRSVRQTRWGSGRSAGVLHTVVAAFVAGLAMTTAALSATKATPQRLSEIGQRLVAAYPDHLAGIEDGLLVWKDGTKMPLDDGVATKDFETLLNSADIEDQFYAPYAKGRAVTPPGLNMDPGRVRHEPFFRKMYGDCDDPRYLAETMADVIWLPTRVGAKIKISKINGIAGQLQKVSDELDKLDATFVDFLHPIAGTLSCRTIAGTDRRSMHGYAAAIDISIKHAHYWRWGNEDGKKKPVYKNSVPMEIVEIFERHGFIWGGKWYHYDTMHFEYRPELLAD
ncbi:MAG: M15 family metallopeptidase [Hyphomicrobiaceae bacterium]|nr:M15 family metallopeptidase [Hyphomicrobiaceae bacterium]